MDSKLASLRGDIDTMAGELFRAIGVPFEQTSELQRQVLAAFAFGMVYAFGRRHGLQPPEVHALVIACLMDVFKYANHQAVAFSETMMDAASNRQSNRTISAIIHRGIDGHGQWECGNLAGMKANIEGILKSLGA